MQETHIHDFKSNNATVETATLDPLKWLKLIGGLCGAALIIVSLVFVFRLFTFFHAQLTDPQTFEIYLQQLIQAIGGEELTLQFGENQVHTANYAAIITFGLGIMIMGWLAAKMLVTGSRMLQICMREARPKPPQASPQASPHTTPQTPTSKAVNSLL